MNQEEYLKVKHAIERAEENTKPIATIVDEQVVAKGDVNDVDVKPQDYQVRFVVPKNLAPQGAKKLPTGFYSMTLDFNDVLPTVKQNVKVTSAGVQVLPFFKKLEESGEVRNMDDAEAIMNIYENLSDETVDALYWFVKAFLEIDDELADYITPGSVLEVGAKIISDFPHIFDQADLF